jgi:AbrB family looped-hinge helix DNA binding protein
MMTTRLSTKGQLIIPKEIRDRHGWTPGIELALEDHGDHVVLREADSLPKTTLADILGCMKYQGPPRTLEEMEDAIAQGARDSR